MFSRYFFMFLLLSAAPLFSAEAPTSEKRKNLKNQIYTIYGQTMMWEMAGKTLVLPNGKPISSQTAKEDYEALCAEEQKAE